MTNDHKKIITKTKSYVKNKLSGEGSGHDWWHVYRVLKNAKHIAKAEKADQFVVQLGALLHDIADWKFHEGDDEIASRITEDLLKKYLVDKETIKHVSQIVKDVSFKGANVKNKINTIEGMVVQDADRLDAIGAIGIGRTFAYGGFKHKEMYNPNLKIHMANSFDEYQKAGKTTINHFYEKLLLLKDLMNTKTGKTLAEERHKFMKVYLKRFFMEWEGKA